MTRSNQERREPQQWKREIKLAKKPRVIMRPMKFQTE